MNWIVYGCLKSWAFDVMAFVEMREGLWVLHIRETYPFKIQALDSSKFSEAPTARHLIFHPLGTFELCAGFSSAVQPLASQSGPKRLVR